MTLAISLRYMGVGEPDAIWHVRWYTGEDYAHLSKKYGVGIVAVTDEVAIRDICPHCDGLIIPGSATDIPPAYYGGAPLPQDPPVDEYAFDAALIKHFYEAKKPILGICGGHQALNVFFGGKIARMPDSKAHENDTEHAHRIEIAPSSFIYDVFGAESATVNSYHAWALDGIAPDFQVTAKTADGVAEAIDDLGRLTVRHEDGTTCLLASGEISLKIHDDKGETK